MGTEEWIMNDKVLIHYYEMNYEPMTPAHVKSQNTQNNMSIFK